MRCKECYSEDKRITPLLHPLDCLQNHTQYICGTCGRCICIEHDDKRGLQRWNFPFRSLDIAMLYLRSADHTMKTACSIYAIQSGTGRVSYKIFVNKKDLELYLRKHKDKHCECMMPCYHADSYTEYSGTQVRRLTSQEIQTYMEEREAL